MRKITSLLLAISFVFASCSSNEEEIINQPKEELLKSYTLKRDASGVYSIDFNVANNTNVDLYKSESNNNIVLSESKATSKTTYTDNFSIENDFLKIGFLQANTEKETKIYIEDENITFANKGVTEFLNSYSISSNEDGTYTLDFTVSDNVQTEFKYNEKIKTYEVHLSIGGATQKEFSRQLEMTSENILKLDFVNHKYLGKTEDAITTEERKPRLEVGE